MPSRTTAPAWRGEFLRELARTGSVAAAAAAVGIDRSSAYQLRGRNPAFAASWDRAMADARAVLGQVQDGQAQDGQAQGEQGPGGDGADSGAGDGAGGRPRLRLRGDECVRASKAGRPCVVRAGPGRWSVEVERAFLAALAETANVAAAARAVGVSTVTAYNRRRDWPGFAAAWRAAKEDGWELLEWLLIEAATASLDPAPEAVMADAPQMSVEQAMRLWFHRDGRAGAGGRAPRYAWRKREPDIEEVRAEIARKLAAIRKAGVVDDGGAGDGADGGADGGVGGEG